MLCYLHTVNERKPIGNRKYYEETFFGKDMNGTDAVEKHLLGRLLTGATINHSDLDARSFLRK